MLLVDKKFIAVWEFSKSRCIVDCLLGGKAYNKEENGKTALHLSYSLCYRNTRPYYTHTSSKYASLKRSGMYYSVPFHLEKKEAPSVKI